MIVKESDIREKIRKILSEVTLTFYSPLGNEENFSIEAPERNGDKLDLSKDNSYDVIRLSKIVDAMTDPGSQNNIAWQTVAEGFLQNFGFSPPLGKQTTFFDVTKGVTGYSVKSSFSASTRNEVGVLSNAKLNFSTYFSSDLEGIDKVSIIACYRKDNISDNTFTIVWKKTPEIDKEVFENALEKNFPNKSNKSNSNANISPGTQVTLFPNLKESYIKATVSEIEIIFSGGFETFLTITFKDFKNEDVEPYKKKLEIMNVLSKASDDQIKDIFQYFLERGLVERNTQ